MINIFKRHKWQIRYIDENGMSAKELIVTAKTMDQAREEFREIINYKKVCIVRIIMIA